jgi:predicted nucleotidyltransferase
MRDIILSKLNQMEKENSIKILYAVEPGSRGWGFASKDSDYDARFIYIRPVEWYLSIEDKKDYIEYPIDDLLDINGWDLKKALQLYKKANPPLMEWLSSPIIYMENYSLAQKMRELLEGFFSPVPAIYHYLHIARKKYEEVINTDQVKIKRYFYILRPLLACMWIEKNNTMPPMEFSKLMEDQKLDQCLIDEINKLLLKKTSGLEIDIEPQCPVIMDFFQNKIHHFENYLKSVKNEKTSDVSLLNALFRETLKEVWG